MYGGGSRGKCPENWQTAEILKWIQDNDDSKGDIKSRVMGVVQANDLDGHTLKQLVAEKDEIQNLFPALKERLAFKSMLRNLFKEEGKVLIIEPPSNLVPKHPPPAPVMVASYPHKLQPVTSFPPLLNSIRFPVTTPTRTYLPREGGSTLPGRPRLHRPVDTHQVTSQKRIVMDRPPIDSVLPKKIRDLIHTEKTFTLPSSVPFSANTSSPINITTQPLYFNSQSTMSPPQAKRQALYHNVTSPPPISRNIPSSCSAPTVTQTGTSIQLPTTPPQPPPQKSPQISSVTSYGLGVVQSEKTPASNSWLVSSSNNSEPKVCPTDSSSAGYCRCINYPAPIPDFEDDILECMAKTGGIRPVVRKRIMRDASQFYVNITMGQRLNSNDYANIGRTMIEKFPALSCGGLIPWALFNKSLSQCIRNLRRRLKKINGGFESLNKVGDDLESGSAVTFDPIDLSDEEIGEGEEDGEQDVFFIKEEIPAWTEDQVQ